MNPLNFQRGCQSHRTALIDLYPLPSSSNVPSPLYITRRVELVIDFNDLSHFIMYIISDPDRKYGLVHMLSWRTLDLDNGPYYLSGADMIFLNLSYCKFLKCHCKRTSQGQFLVNCFKSFCTMKKYHTL